MIWIPLSFTSVVNINSSPCKADNNPLPSVPGWSEHPEIQYLEVDFVCYRVISSLVALSSAVPVLSASE